MSIIRIAFNDSASYTGAYYLTLNPSVLDLHNSSAATPYETLDGAPIHQEPYFDSRPYMFSWKGINSDYSGFTAMLTILKGYVGSVKYVNFGTADYALPALGWVKVRVVNVDVQIESGGRIKYNVSVMLYPEA